MDKRTKRSAEESRQAAKHNGNTDERRTGGQRGLLAVREDQE
jgi:hypothetical protein